MNHPLITVAIPAYNAQKYIRETIDSILHQTEQDFELIIINDGSTDNTEEIAKSYSDSRIRYYTNGENLGIAKTYNRIIERANGKYLAIAEADDISHPERLKIQSAFLDKHDNVAAVSAQRINFRGEPPVFKDILPADRLSVLHTAREIRSSAMFQWSRFRHAVTMYRTDALKKYNIYYDSNFLVSADYDLLLRLCLRADIVTLKPGLLAYRMHDDSYSSTKQTNSQNPISTMDFSGIRAKYFGDVLNDIGQVDDAVKLKKLVSVVENFVTDRKHNADFDYNILTQSASSFLYSRMRKLERRTDDYWSIYRIYRQSKLLKNIRVLRRVRLNVKAVTKIPLSNLLEIMFCNLLSKRPPRIFIPAKQTTGGPATFLRNLKTHLDAVDYPYTTKYQRGDSIFFPIRHKVSVLDKVKKHGGQIIQRLDGAYGADEPMRRDRLANVYHNYADWVIYQSEWCKQVCDYQMGIRQSSQYRIIPNGVNGNIFYPSDKTYSGNEPVEFVMSGRFKNTDMLNLALIALDKLHYEGLDFRLHLIVQYQHNTAQGYADRQYVALHGAQDMQGVAELLRQSHIYIFSDANPPCPNAVLEAAASGLPVVSFDSGSMAELLPFGAPLLAPVSGDLIQQKSDFHADALAEKLLLAVENYSQFRATAVAHANDYPFTACGDAYREVFELVADER